MGIQDITSSSITTSSTIPVPPLDQILQLGSASSLAENPLSGSILKLLGENGFKQKIEDGYKNGHTYTILHSAPSKDFILIDTWIETRVDESGNTITVPRKNYQIFTITLPKKTSTESTSDNHPPIDPSPIDSSVTSSLIDTPLETLSEIPTGIDSSEMTTHDQAKKVADKIKRGGAGMTPEDWQFRNDNWHLIEAELTPTTTPVVAQPTSETPEIEPSVVKKEIAPIKPSPTPMISTETAPTSKLTPQHYDSRALLMQKLKQKNSSQKTTAPSSLVTQGNNPSIVKTLSSYELLRKKFASSTKSIVSETPLSSSSTSTVSSNMGTFDGSIAPSVIETVPDTRTRKNNLIVNLFGNDQALWTLAQTIPARAFIYPSEYYWGTDDQGRPVEHTLEHYPLPARKLREKIAQSVEEVATQGVLIETTPLGKVLDIIFEKGIL